jgi:hypothetical protein
MRGPWPKAPAREQWTPPPGWTKPSKPVTSWYDRGDRLTSTVTAKATVMAPAPIDPAETALAESIAASTVALLSPANALTYLSGAATRQSLLAKGVSLDVINEATAVVREAVASMPKEWPALGGSGAFHPMRGPWPKAPAREQWTPPPGWIKPSKPVTSWYDRGDRLTVTKAASTQVEWPALGGSGAFHPMRGPWPKAPAREQWTPPPGWTKPSKPVLSWYDKGERLSSQQAPIIQATKANIMPKGGWVVTQPDGATEQVGWSTGMPSETSLATPGSPNRAPQIVLLGAVLGGAFLAARSFGIRML